MRKHTLLSASVFNPKDGLYLDAIPQASKAEPAVKTHVTKQPSNNTLNNSMRERPQTARPMRQSSEKIQVNQEEVKSFSKTVSAQPTAEKTRPQTAWASSPSTVVTDRDKRWEMRRQRRMETATVSDVRVNDQRIDHSKSPQKLKEVAQAVLKDCGEPFIPPTQKRRMSLSIHSESSNNSTQDFFSRFGNKPKERKHNDLFGRKKFNIITGEFEGE
jgi:hypothetical protein